MPPLKVEADKCKSCKRCMTLGCPAISMKDGKAVELATEGAVDAKKLGSYTITYSAEKWGQSAEETRTVTIIDTAKPTLKLKGEEKVTILRGNEYKEPGYSAEDNYDGDLTKAATSLSVGETSEPITVYNNQNQGYFILWAAEKSDAHFTDNYEKIARECINDTIGRDLDAITRELAESIRYTDAYETLDRATISMND